jgi:hypothetical protein
VPDEPKKSVTLRGRRWILLLIAFGAVFVGLRGIHALADQPEESAIFTDRVVVVGVTGRPEPTATDRAVLGSHLGDAQAGAMSIRPRCGRMDDAGSRPEGGGWRSVRSGGPGREGDRLARAPGGRGRAPR